MQVPNYGGASNINVAERQRPGPGGQIVKSTLVTFNVGTHGPFSLEYPDNSFTPATAKADIQKKVALVNELMQANAQQ